MSSQGISFDQIQANILKPGIYTEFNTKLAAVGLASFQQFVSLVGPMLAAGTVAENTPTRIFDSEKAAALFGRGSIIHQQAIAAFAASSSPPPSSGSS